MELTIDNPQLEDGYTKIVTSVIEALGKTRIPGEAMQILFVIIRKTWGYNKKQDCIPLSQFCSASGMKKPNVCRAIEKLLAMNIIIKKDNGIIPEYQFNKKSTTWKPLSKKITLSKKIMTVIEKDNASLSKKIPSKDNSSKDISSKDNNNAASNEIAKNLPEEISSSQFFSSLKPRFYAELRKDFSETEIIQEIRKAERWLIANPRRQKSDYQRFFNNWMNNYHKIRPRDAPGDINRSRGIITDPSQLEGGIVQI